MPSHRQKQAERQKATLTTAWLEDQIRNPNFQALCGKAQAQVDQFNDAMLDLEAAVNRARSLTVDLVTTLALGMAAFKQKETMASKEAKE